jgi:hypothetical protein
MRCHGDISRYITKVAESNETKTISASPFPCIFRRASGLPDAGSCRKSTTGQGLLYRWRLAGKPSDLVLSGSAGETPAVQRAPDWDWPGREARPYDLKPRGPKSQVLGLLHNVHHNDAVMLHLLWGRHEGDYDPQHSSGSLPRYPPKGGNRAHQRE